jgi:hypothetical protein
MLFSLDLLLDPILLLEKHHLINYYVAEHQRTLEPQALLRTGHGQVVTQLLCITESLLGQL